MALPNTGMDAVPFTPLTAEFLDDMIENIEALSTGTGLASNAITTAKITNASVTTDKLSVVSSSNTATVATQQTTTSTSYVDLGTVGPTVTTTITASGCALVNFGAQIYNDTTDKVTRVSFAASGANTIAAGSYSFYVKPIGTTTTDNYHQITLLLTGLTAGSTTFTLKYSVSGGTAYYSARALIVIPL